MRNCCFWHTISDCLIFSTEVCTQNNWRSEQYSRLKCELVIMGLLRNICFSCICYFMLLPTCANHSHNHNQICIASWTESNRGAECIRPIPESGAIAIFIFYFSFSAENVGTFYFLLFFGQKNEIAFSVLFIFRPKKENPFTIGL